MKQILGILRYVFTNFGPLLVFSSVFRLYGLKAAIALSVLYTLGEIIYVRIKGEKLTPFFVFSAAVSLLFGAIDLYLPGSFLFKYEASLSNIITGVFFTIGAFTEKPLIQEFAEKRRKFAITPELIYFFRIFTLIWAGYFFLKAGLYLYMAELGISLEKSLLIRALVGSVSFYALLAISTFGGRYLFLLLKRWGLLRGAQFTT